MNCAELDLILDDHRLSRLPRAEQSAVEEHLRNCARCAPLWQANELLAAESLPAPTAAAFGRVLDHLETESGRVQRASARRPIGRFALPFGLAATLLLAALAFWQLRPAPELSAGAAGTALTAQQATGSGSDVAASGAEVRRFVEGRHYSRIAGTQANPRPAGAAGVVEIEEFFMYTCPHCYTFEGLFDPWCEAQPEFVQVTRVPVVFNPVARLHARAFYAAQLLGIDEAMHEALLAAIHERGESMSTELELAALAARVGVSADEFLAALGSTAVLGLVGEAEQRARSYGIRATPTLVVGREFQILPGSAGSYEDMLEVAGQLIEDAIFAPRCAGNAAVSGEAPDACDAVL